MYKTVDNRPLKTMLSEKKSVDRARDIQAPQPYVFVPKNGAPSMRGKVSQKKFKSLYERIKHKSHIAQPFQATYKVDVVTP